MHALLKFAAISSLAIASATQAATFSCTAKIATASMEDTGFVSAQFPGYLPFKICNINFTTPDSITPETCKVWLSQMLTAAVTGKYMILYFNTDNAYNANMTSDCATANFYWNERHPYFVQLVQ